MFVDQLFVDQIVFDQIFFDQTTWKLSAKKYEEKQRHCSRVEMLQNDVEK